MASVKSIVNKRKLWTIYACPISPKDIKKGVDELPNIFDMVSPYSHAMDMLTH